MYNDFDGYCTNSSLEGFFGYTYCGSPDDYNNKSEHAICEVYYWVNASSAGFWDFVIENYPKEWVREVLTNYINGVKSNAIPEWKQDGSHQKQIIDYLVQKNRTIPSSVEPRIRAIFSVFIKGVHPVDDRQRINPCYLYPKSERCEGGTALTDEYIKGQGTNGNGGNSVADVNNLLQTVVIGAVVVTGMYFAFKLVKK